MSPGGGTGIRARLKIVSRKGCGFDPHPGHHDKTRRIFEKKLGEFFSRFYVDFSWFLK